MTSKELLHGYEVDLNQLIDTFAKEVDNGDELNFQTFKRVWSSMHLSFILVTASEESVIESYIQDLYMCVLDRFDMPSPLIYGKLFGDIHKPRLRSSLHVQHSMQPCSAPSEKIQQPDTSNDDQSMTSFFTKEIPDFEKSSLSQLITLEERVGVIYALYCLFKEQCLTPKVCIHMPVDILQQFVTFLPKLKDKGVMDALYIFQILWREHAFVFDAIRRPPGFLSLPLETSEFESQSLRDLAFHLKTSLQDLGKVERIEKLCDEYLSLQHKLVTSNLGHQMEASKLMTFNGDIGSWLKSVMNQETHHVHQGITGLTPRISKANSKAHLTPKPKKQVKKKSTTRPKAALKGVTLNADLGDDSWGIGIPGIPKTARLVMLRDKQRRKQHEQQTQIDTAEVSVKSTTQKVTQSQHQQELETEDFYQACSDLRAFKSSKQVEDTEYSEDEDLVRLQNTVSSLQEELNRSKRHSQ